MKAVRRTPSETNSNDVCAWYWPECPSSFTVYDKYADVDEVLKLDDAAWQLPVQGRKERFTFAAGAGGVLQRKLILLTQTEGSPSTISKFTRSLIKNWPVYVELLSKGPAQVTEIWDKQVLDVDTAKAGKTILKTVCLFELGEWRRLHLAKVSGLDTRAKRGLSAQHRKIKRREKLLPVGVQAEVVRVLDEGAGHVALSGSILEGLAALALMYQHAMRPVQLLALRLEHVPEPVVDAAGDPVMVVSFHTAKRGGKVAEEMLRQVKPEWASLVSRLRTEAMEAGRTRLFSVASRDALVSLVRRGCSSFGFTMKLLPYELRHTSVQSLADAGHERAEIKKFLGHRNLNAANSYLRASRQQGEIVNKALGTSKLYSELVALTKDSFISVKKVSVAEQDMQIGGVVGGRLIAGIGLCKSGQPTCTYNPVTSCYGCRKFMPVADEQPHRDAIDGMREQVKAYLQTGLGEGSPALMQLTTALSGAQQAIQIVGTIAGAGE